MTMEVLEKIRSVATLALLRVPYEKEMKELEKEWGREELKKAVHATGFWIVLGKYFPLEERGEWKDEEILRTV